MYPIYGINAYAMQIQVLITVGIATKRVPQLGSSVCLIMILTGFMCFESWPTKRPWLSCVELFRIVQRQRIRNGII
jgi:hypothetical protein